MKAQITTDKKPDTTYNGIGKPFYLINNYSPWKKILSTVINV